LISHSAPLCCIPCVALATVWRQPMSYRHSLRTRLILSYPLLGAVVGLLLAGLLFFALESMEHQFMEAYVMGDLQYFMDNTNGAAEMRSAYWVAYRTPKDKAPPGFEHLIGLESGLHEIENENEEYYVGVMERADERFYLLFDELKFEDTGFEDPELFIIALLLGIFLATAITATWFGFWLSGRVIQPIKDLAQQVQAIEPTAESEPLARGFAGDEVGDLATAFDAYQERLVDFVCREREFTADASHELRSPLAVIQATAEGMLSNKALPDALQPKIERIMRAAEGMGGTLEVLLWLAREKVEISSLGDWTDLAAEVERLVTSQQESLANRPVVLNLDLRARPELKTPPAAAIMVVDNLLRNALAYTTEGDINILLEEGRLVVEDSGPGIAPADLQRIFERGKRGANVKASGRGLGLAIASRLCERFGWSLQLESPAQGGVRAEWRFH